MLVHPEVGIGIHPVLMQVEPFEFFLTRYPDSNGFLQGEDDGKGREHTKEAGGTDSGGGGCDAEALMAGMLSPPKA